MAIFNTNDSLEEVLRKIDGCHGVTESIQIGSIFLNYKLQEKLLENQNKYNRKQLFWSRSLSIFTAILAIATIALVFVIK